MNRFERFGLEHVATLVVLAAVAISVSWILRRGSAGVRRAIRYALAGFLSIGLLFALIDSLPLRGHEWLDILPLHLCDLAVLIGAWAILTVRRTAVEILYFWGLSGTLIAMFMPDVDRGFPDSRCISFFALHGAVAISAIALTFGLGVRPRPRANLKIFALTNAYAALVAVVDLVAGENYLYLRAKPSQPSILDVMGPWPWYLVAADALAFVLFALLMVPFRNQSGLEPHLR